MKSGQKAQIYNIRFGFTDNKKPERIGQSWCMDNLSIYYDTKPVDENGNPAPMKGISDIYDVEKYGYGEKVNTEKNKPIKILGQETGGGDFINEGIVMKIGSNNMLYKGKKEQIFVNKQTGESYGAPLKIGDIVYVPFEAILNSTGYPSYAHDDGITYDI